MAESTTGPAINITDAGAGAATFSGSESRSYNYFTPKGRHASVYEDVTVDVQPDPKRYLLQGWLYAFADGTAGYDESWTKMKSSDWHVRSEEHTSELQSLAYLVCRLLLEKKK